MTGFYVITIIYNGIQEKYRDMALNHFEIKSEERVLEIGFGTGHALS